MQLGTRDSDQRLLRQARRGDEEAFERLYSRYQPRIFAFCRHLTGHREDAEDAVQFTFLAAYRAIVESDRRLDLRPWLFTVARNRCMSLLRARRNGHLDQAGEVSVESVADQVEQRQAIRDLVRDLGGLPEEQRAALLLSELGALSHGDVATVLDVPPAKVKALVFQARSSLVSTREARDASCEEIRQQLSTLSGSALRRRLLRRHVSECAGCRDFEAAVAEQRKGLAALVPPAVVVGGRGAVGVLSATGSGAGGLSAGGLLGGGITGSLMALGTQGAVSVAVAATVVVGGAVGVAATDLPARLGAGPAAPAVAQAHARDTAEGRNGDVMVSTRPEGVGDDRREEQGAGESSPAVPRSSGPEPSQPGSEPDHVGVDGGGERDDRTDGAPGGAADAGDLPPGLQRDGDLPPGLARKDALPPGLAKRGSGGPADPHGTKSDGRGGNANGKGNGPTSAESNGSGGNGGAGRPANGKPAAGGNGNAGGGSGNATSGNGNASGGNGNGGSGNPGAGGNGQAADPGANGNGGGHGTASPGAGSNGNGGGSSEGVGNPGAGGNPGGGGGGSQGNGSPGPNANPGGNGNLPSGKGQPPATQ